MMGLEVRVHGNVVGTSCYGPASVLRHWEPEPGHPAAEIITGWEGNSSGEAGGGGRKIEMPDSNHHSNSHHPKSSSFLKPRVHCLPMPALWKKSLAAATGLHQPQPCRHVDRASRQDWATLRRTENRQYHDNKEVSVKACTTVLIRGTSSGEMGHGQ